MAARRFLPNRAGAHAEQIENLRSKVHTLQEQNAVHWKTRATLVRQLTKARKAAEDAIDVIFLVENRCMAVDGPVTPTLQEITEAELREIYLALERLRKAVDLDDKCPECREAK